MTVRINEEQIRMIVEEVINESQMACMKYFPRVRKIVRCIIKDFIDEVGDVKDDCQYRCYMLTLNKNETIKINAYPYFVYEKIFSEWKDTLGFHCDGNIYLKIRDDECVSELVSTVMH